MKKSPLLLVLSGALALAGATLLPQSSNGQAAIDADPALTQALIDVTAQQVVIADNQTKIDAFVAKIGEDVRVARIFSARGGGKTK